MIQTGLALAGILIATIFDWRQGRIPNWLTFSMILSGLAVNFLDHGVAGLEQSFLGLTFGILFLFIPFAIGGVGGGDVKLIGAIGSLLGPGLILKIFVVSAIFGGIFSLISMVRRKVFRKTLIGIRDRLIYFALTKKAPQEEKWEQSKSRLAIPYAFAVCCGTILVLLVLRGG